MIQKIKRKVKRIILYIKGYSLNILLKVKYFFKKNSDIAICISTTKGYAEKTIPTLINDLLKNKINPKNIFVFEGGWNEDVKIEKEYNYYKVKHNSFDLTALISILELNIKKKYWLLLHDTLELDNTFKYKFFTLKPKKYDCLPLKKFPSMNIGVYTQQYLEKNRDYILSVKNTDYSESSLKKYKALGVDFEDHLFKITDNKKIIHDDLKVFFKSQEKLYHRSRRLCEYYPQLGIVKYKANFKKVAEEQYSINI